jgi:hypothetical protein
LGNQGNYAVADIEGTYDEVKLDWIMHKFIVRVYNSEGVEIPHEENWEVALD